MNDFNFRNDFDNIPQQPNNDIPQQYIQPPVSEPAPVVIVPPKPPKKEKSFGFGTVLLASLISAAVAFTASIAVFVVAGDFTASNDTNTVTEPFMEGDTVNINVDEEVSSVVEAVAKKVTPSVVGIRTTTSYTSFFGDEEASGEGSGVIYREDGYIITNYHVIADAMSGRNGSKIEVFLGDADSTPYNATVVGYHISSDLAVIKIDAAKLPKVDIADSSKLNVGQYVITVGNPGGLEFMDSVTYGVISGLDRKATTDDAVSLIQTDAAINPGNSGGALVNTKGELVGINSSKIVAEEYEGMGFAIPVNTVVEICDGIIDDEGAVKPYIGVTVSEKYTAEVLKEYGYPSGAVVSSVDENSPAYNAGIRRGDIITSFNGTDIKEYTDLSSLVSKCKPNQTVDVKIYRNGRLYTSSIVIGSNSYIN